MEREGIAAVGEVLLVDGMGLGSSVTASPETFGPKCPKTHWPSPAKSHPSVIEKPA